MELSPLLSPAEGMALSLLTPPPADSRVFVDEVQQKEIQRCAEEIPRAICGVMMGQDLWHGAVM